jgi:hypothetical protein
MTLESFDFKSSSELISNTFEQLLFWASSISLINSSYKPNANIKGKTLKSYDNANLKGKTLKSHDNANLKGKTLNCHDNANLNGNYHKNLVSYNTHHLL